MATFTLTPGAWVQIIAPGGSRDQQVQVTHGRVLLCFGAPDSSTSSIVSSTVDNKLNYAPAGVEVNARASKAAAIVTTGDY